MRAFRLRALIAVCFIAALACQHAAANDNSKRLTVMDVFNIEFAADPQISPDGKRIIYMRQFSDIMTDKRYSNLWIVNFDGSEHRPLTTGHYNDSSPRWSPDRTRVIFTSATATARRRSTCAGWTPARRRSSQSSDFPPVGRRLVAGREVDRVHIARARDARPSRADARGAARREMGRAREGHRQADLSLRRRATRRAGYTHLFVIPAEGGTPRQISSGNFQHGGVGFRASDAVWTPDGKYLLMSANRRPDYELEPLDTEVYEFSVADGAVRALTNRKGPDDSPAVSPDGRRVAYVGFDDRTRATR